MELTERNSTKGCINHTLKEEQLKEAFLALFYVAKQELQDEGKARKYANDYVYGAFRNLFTYDSLITFIINKARLILSH